MFLSVEGFLDAVGMDTSLAADLESTITEAITRAQFELETMLGFRLQSEECTDAFNPTVDHHSGVVGQGGLFKLRLTKPFVLSSPTPEVKYSSTWNGDFSVVDSTLYRLDRTSGYLLVDPSVFDDLEGGWIQAQYSAGFTDHTDCDPRVQQALAALTVKTMKLLVPASSDSGAKASGKVSAETIAETLLRPGSLQYYPVFSTRN
jgi:hypothetical protein